MLSSVNMRLPYMCTSLGHKYMSMYNADNRDSILRDKSENRESSVCVYNRVPKK